MRESLKVAFFLQYFTIYLQQTNLPLQSVAEFADDKAIISVHENRYTASANIQSYLDQMSVQYEKWGIKINQTKSTHTTFTLCIPPCFEISLVNILIPLSQLVKYLGLTINRRLTWTLHNRTKKIVLNKRQCSIKVLISNKHTKFRTQLLMYKSLISPCGIFSG